MNVIIKSLSKLLIVFSIIFIPINCNKGNYDDKGNGVKKENKKKKKRKSKKQLEEEKLSYSNIDIAKIFTNYIPLKNEDDIRDQVKTYFQKYWKNKNLSGGLLVARQNKILFEEYAGYKNLELEKMPISDSTSLHIASVSKVITSLAILKLVENNKITLKQSVKSILPDFPYPNINIEQLLTHRSGLPNYAYIADIPGYWDKFKSMTNKDMMEMFVVRKPSLEFTPGNRFIYCNTNYAFLAIIVEKIMKLSFPKAIKKMIFDPLEMNNSYIFQLEDMPDFCSYTGRLKLFEFNHLDLIYGDKNMFSTPKDLFKLSLAMYSSNFLDQKLLAKMFSPHSEIRKNGRNYGLGVRMVILNNGKKLIFHNGWWHGSNSVFVHLLDEKVTIVAIGNRFSNSVYSAVRLASLFGDYQNYIDF